MVPREIGVLHSAFRYEAVNATYGHFEGAYVPDMRLAGS